jgi:hypothetical protein
MRTLRGVKYAAARKQCISRGAAGDTLGTEMAKRVERMVTGVVLAGPEGQM